MRNATWDKKSVQYFSTSYKYLNKQKEVYRHLNYSLYKLNWERQNYYESINKDTILKVEYIFHDIDKATITISGRGMSRTIENVYMYQNKGKTYCFKFKTKANNTICFGIPANLLSSLKSNKLTVYFDEAKKEITYNRDYGNPNKILSRYTYYKF